MKIGIIGAGYMGSAFAKGLQKNPGGAKIFVSDKNEDKLVRLRRAGIKTAPDNKSAGQNADVLILAVKPQDFEECLYDLRGAVRKNCIVISIAAGVKIGKISRILRHKLVCRVMPNLLAAIGESMSVWHAPGFNAGQKLIMKSVLSAVGEELEVAVENDIDKATAISGSGPAYVWYFMEKLIEAAVNLGLSEAVSRKLTSQTFFGASKMGTGVVCGAGDFKTLRQQVTSKKGTTERAIKIFEKKHLPKIFEMAVKAAYKRAKELSE